MTLYEHITDDLIKAIKQEHLKPGDKIPSIAELRAQYNVSHVTALRVYKELSAVNMIVRKEGKGYFVPDPTAFEKRKILGRIGNFLRPMRKISAGDNYFNEIIIGVQSAIGQQRIDFLQSYVTAGLNGIISGGSIQDELKKAMLKAADFVDGYLFDERISDEVIKAVITQTGKPGMLVNRCGLPNIVCSETFDNASAVNELYRLGVNMGYVNFILCASGENIGFSNYNINARRDAFIELAGADHQHFHAIDNCSLRQKTDFIPEIQAQYRKMRGRGKVLLIAVSDSLARVIADELFPNERSGDSDLGVCGIGGLGYARHGNMAITTAAIDAFSLGSQAVVHLLEMIFHAGNCPKNYLSLPTLEFGNSM